MTENNLLLEIKNLKVAIENNTILNELNLKLINSSLIIFLSLILLIVVTHFSFCSTFNHSSLSSSIE